MLFLAWFFLVADDLAATWNNVVPSGVLRLGAVMGWYYAGRYLVRTLPAPARGLPAVVIDDDGLLNRSFGYSEYIRWEQVTGVRHEHRWEKRALTLLSRRHLPVSINLDVIPNDAADHLVDFIRARTTTPPIPD